MSVSFAGDLTAPLTDQVVRERQVSATQRESTVLSIVILSILAIVLCKQGGFTILIWSSERFSS